MKRVALNVTSVLAVVLFAGSVSKAQGSDFAKLGFASETEMQNYLQITEVKVTEIPADNAQFSAPAPNPVLALGAGVLQTLGPVLMNPSGISGWIAFGQKIWDVVVANQPVVNVKTTRVTVLPNDKNAWAQMSGWRGPAASSYNIQAVNGFGMTVVNQKYTISYNYGGQLNNQGRYLANVTIIPTAIDVSWGYTLNSNVEVGQILNTGSVQAPVPAVDLQLKWEVKTILKDSQGVDSFSVKGDGSLTHVSQ
jgi:hypothetical protein